MLLGALQLKLPCSISVENVFGIKSVSKIINVNFYKDTFFALLTNLFHSKKILFSFTKNTK